MDCEKEVLNTFHCERMDRDIQFSECIAHRKVARWADLSQLGVHDLPEWAWGFKDSCLDCPQGEQVEADWQEVRKVSPRDKSKWRRRELIVDETVLRMPLCSECGRWVAVPRTGLCKSCYQRKYRKERKSCGGRG